MARAGQVAEGADFKTDGHCPLPKIDSVADIYTEIASTGVKSEPLSEASFFIIV
jgi:hypothetical protein